MSHAMIHTIKKVTIPTIAAIIPAMFLFISQLTSCQRQYVQNLI